MNFDLRSALAAIFLLLIPAMAAARVDTRVENVNGFEVRYIDLGRGDRLEVSYQVPFGTLSESGEFMGRAHLLQHTMFAGSKAFPGENTYRETMQALEVSTEASTGNARTLYNARGSKRDARSILQLFFAPLGGLEWNAQTFVNQRETVINEAEESRQDDSSVLNGMLFTQLLPSAHPWNHVPSGDRRSLSKMNMDSLKEFYYANYRPENIKVTIAGDFSDPAFLAQVKDWTRAYLQPAAIANDPARYRQRFAPLSAKYSPSLFANPQDPLESERRLYIESPSAQRLSLVLLEADLSQFRGPREALDVLIGALKHAAPETSFSIEKIGHKVHLRFETRLSEARSADPIEHNTALFKLLRDLQADSVAARLFHPARALYVEMGPAKEEMLFDEVYQRHYKLEDNRAALRAYRAAIEDNGPQTCESHLIKKGQ